MCDAQSFQRCHDVLAVSARAHVAIDLENPPVGADVKRPARCKSRRARHAPRARRRRRRIAENRKIGSERLREPRVRLDAVGARREVGDVERSQRIAARPERPTFGGSTTCERFRKPCHDDGTHPDEIAKAIRMSIRRG